MRIQHLLGVAAAVTMAGSLAAAQESNSASPGKQTTQQSSRQAGSPDMASRLKQREPSPQVSGERPAVVTLVTSPTRITSAPAQFYGIPVSVHARVARRSSPHVFTLEDESWWRVGNNLVVLIPSPRPGAALDTDEYVTVTGTVRPFVRAEIERDYDWFDFDALPDLNVNLEGRPVLVADMARTSDGVMLTQSAQPATRVLVASAGDIADVPGRFYGRTVSVAAEVEDVWSPRAFTMDEDEWFAGPDVLVFNPNPIASGPGDLDNEFVTVLGTVRPFFVSEFETEYEWFDAADYQRFDLASLERRPVIVASSIRGENNRELVQFQPALAIDVAEANVSRRTEEWARMAREEHTERPRRDERGTTGQQPATATDQPGR